MTIELIALLAACASAGGVLPTLVTVIGNRRKEKVLGEIEHEVKPNGGGSMRDRVNRIGDDVAELAKTVQTVVEGQQTAAKRDQEHAERLAVLEDRTYPGVRPATPFWRR